MTVLGIFIHFFQGWRGFCGDYTLSLRPLQTHLAGTSTTTRVASTVKYLDIRDGGRTSAREFRRGVAFFLLRLDLLFSRSFVWLASDVDQGWRAMIVLRSRC